MQWSDVSFQPPARVLRQFAALWLLFFGALACWQWLGRERPAAALALAALAVLVGGPGLVWPQAVRWVYVGCTVATFPVGWVVSQAVLALLFFGVFTPIALVFRMIGRDALGRRYAPEQETYWVPKPAADDPRSYFRQF